MERWSEMTSLRAEPKESESLDTDVDEDSEAAWSAEIARRLGELDSGAVKPIPWEKARRMILEAANAGTRR